MTPPESPRPHVPPQPPRPLPGPLVDAAWLAPRLGAEGLVVLDASVGVHRDAETRIPGARRFDLDGALSDHHASLPHTMPEPDRLAAELRTLGLRDEDTVVVYDAAGVYSSPRAWWMLRAVGFDRAAVLDGGLPAWTAYGGPVEEAAQPLPPSTPGDFTARPRSGLFVGADRVADALRDPDAAVLDARTRARFTGRAPEPRPGLRGGHMPGAVSLPFSELLGNGGRMRPPHELREAFREAAGDRGTLVFSCGSGVTACVLALGAHLAGLENLSVYDGSWSEWGLPVPGRPVATGATGATGPGRAGSAASADQAGVS
ncbi:sulfurtransferase [Streptomyces sp. RKND-216]|uniref:sulfurtransferase n=1 Tax=Streptomyces sp. RKND-216 TaxID=2562581 RepID=UPI001FF7B3F1|nr:sulfurtransferase [Streptomyces sp. RKND-216]